MKPSEWIRERVEELVRKSRHQQTRVLLEGRAIMDFLDYWQENDRANEFLAALRRHVSRRQELEYEEDRRRQAMITKEIGEIYDAEDDGREP